MLAERKARAALLGFGLALSLATAAGAADRTHTVAAGESASAIAERYYGDYGLADLLLRYNDRTGSVIRPGETLRVPFCAVHTVQPGDSWSKLAERYLGRPSAWPEIAELNGLDRDRALQPGQRLVMPVVLSHDLERGESLVTLAERFYGDSQRARLLQSFNRIEDPRSLSVGRAIEVPLSTLLAVDSGADAGKAEQREAEAERKRIADEKAAALRARAEAAAAEEQAAALEARRKEQAGELRSAVVEAREAYDAGEFDRAAELLEAEREAAERVDDDSARAEYWRLATFVEIAFDRADEACAAWLEVVKANPDVSLDANRISPKIRRAVEDCSG